ncbi:MAG: hypothetical protein EAZ65_04525 [Verrucomicrobia bacterium]|nr:MAG: hypothetical protein EAZ84_00740 [Verrucomicrobiota bacterium]TAE88009.1 MAG: hypothetical protein EAZ82_05775 [Verrucomicrobiota bacterium]TAF26232.1 MAG: hypothetical protein EAZ71_05340 [Verrucomicrobiota bacterium]TAF41787.1 MAG: hypothetical protein EAZ65_04525 [Verrucomicrobiota bacterium]
MPMIPRFFLVLLAIALLQPMPATAQSYQWRNVEVGGCGFVTGTVFHPTEPGLVYARTDVGGAYRLDAGSNRWIALNDSIGGLNNEFQHLGVQTIALDPSNPDRLYLATGQYAGTESWKLNSRVYRSTDRGATWTYTTPGFKMAGNGEGRGTGERMVVDPLNGANLLVGSNNLGIWRSTNYGANWSRLPNFPAALTDLNFLLYAPASHPGPGPQRRLYAAAKTLTGESFWFTDNNGDSWTEVPNHPGKTPGAEMMPLQGSFDAAGVFYSTWGNATGPSNYASNHGVWKMSADGSTWTSILPPTGQGFFAGISADPRVAGHVVVSTLLRWWPGDEVYRSTDGGATWTAALRNATKSLGNSPWATPAPHWITDIDIDPHNSARAIFNTGFGLFQTTNLAASGSTRTWTFFNDGLEEAVPLGLHSPTAGPPLVSVIGDYTGFRHDDLNRSPRRGALSPGSGSTSVITGAYLAPSKMIRQNSGTTLFSQDAAATWAAFPTTPAPIINGHNRVVLSTDGQRLLWCPPNAPAYLSTDNGATWTVSATGLSAATSNGTQTVSILAGSAGTPGTTNATGGDARFNSPSAIALDSSGVRYIADTDNHSIRRVAAGGGVNTMAGGAGVSGSTDATSTNARFNSPAGIAVDAAKNVFVADTANHTIRKITSSGVVTTIAGSPGVPGSTDASGTNARFNSPAGLAIDGSGNLYVCDSANHTIRKITSSGVVTTIAGSPGVSGTTNATGSAASFNNPRGITLDASGNLFVADSGNHAIRRISTAGQVTTFAGLAGSSGSTDATATAARFNTPKAIAIDASGIFYVADSGNHTIRKITSAAVVSTVAGLAGNPGSASGSGTTARFNSPSGIAVTPDGLNCYVADTANHTIRRNYLHNTLTPLADRVDGNRLYLWDNTQKRLLTSSDGGASFSTIATGVNSAFAQFRTVPGHNGHIWARAGASGLYRSTNFGATFTKLSAVAEVYQFDFGKAKPGSAHPTVFIWGKVGTTVGFFRSDDTGATWTRINDSLHNFGYQNDIAGDPRMYGRLYLATSGRGVVYGDIANPLAPASIPSQVIFDDALDSAWSNASPAGTSLASTSPVRRGTLAVSVASGSGKGLSLTCASRSLEGFAALAFWINAGSAAPPPLQVGASRGGIALEAAPIPVPATAGWERVVVPFADLGLANITDLTGLRIESRVVNGVSPIAFSLDDIELVGNDEFNGISTATITLGTLSQSYTGTPRIVTASTIPAGLPVLLTYNGSTTAPTNVGSYAVSAVIDDPTITGSATGTLVVSKANATILLGNLSPSADGTPKVPTVATTPAGLAVSLTYNGSSTAPSRAGSYAIVATITDPNHQGSTTSTLLIRQPALPATGLSGWASNISGKVSGESSSSPLLNPNDTTDSYSTNTLQTQFSPITLVNPGDKITLTGRLQMTSAAVSGQGNWFRFGLYDNRGQAPNIATDWLGLTAMGSSSSSLYERTGNGLFSTGSGATARTPDGSPSAIGSASPAGNPELSFEVTITRSANSVVTTHLVKRVDNNTSLLSYTYTDTTPNNNGLLTGSQGTATGYVPTYNTAGFAFSRGYIGSTGAQAQFSNIQVSFVPGVTAEPQTIAFDPIADRPVNAPTLELAATASSGLPVSYTLVSGPATLTGNSLAVTGLGTVTVRASQAGNLNFLAAPDVEQSFAVVKASATLGLVGLDVIYDGTAKSVTATTNPPGLTATLTYDGGTTAPSAAGSYAVVASIDDPVYQGSASGTLVIGKAPQSITFAPLPDRTFGDASFALSASAGLPVSFSIVSGPASLDGTLLSLDGAGVVTVRASQPGDANHLAAADVERSFAVAKAAAILTLDALEVPYDGLPKPVLVSTQPPGLAVTVTYNGSAEPPLAPGTYAVSALVDDPDYVASANATLIIGNRGYTTDLTDWLATSSSLADAESSSPLWNPTNANAGLAGSAHAFFSPVQLVGTGDSLKLTGTVAVQVNSNSRPVNNKGLWFRFGLFRNQTPLNPPAAPVTTDWLGYCGMVSSSAALYERTGTSSYGSSFTGNSARTPQTSLPGVNSTQNSITLRFTETITRTATGVDVSFEAVNTATNAKVMSFTYSDDTPNNNGVLNGSQATPTGYSPTFSAAGFVFSGEYIGTSNASAQFTNVQLTYSTPSPGNSQAIVFDPVADRSYGSSPIALTATASSGLPVSYSVVSGPATLDGNLLSLSGVGDITIRATQAGNVDYLPALPSEQSFTVTKAAATVTLANLAHVHDGTAKSATATTDPANRSVDLRYDGEQNAPYEVGSYEVTAVVSDDLYEGSASGILVIEPSPQSIDFAPLGDRVFGDPPLSLTATSSSGLPVFFTIVSGPATLDGDQISITGAGRITVRASQPGDSTRAPAPDIDRSFSVAKASATVILGELATTYSGEPQGVAVTTFPEGLSVVLTYDGSSSIPIAAGSYAVVASIDDPNHAGSASGTLVIAKAAQTIDFAPLSDLAEDNPPFAPVASASSGLPVSLSILDGPAILDGSLITLTGAGTVTVRATQSGDANHLAALPVDRSFSVAAVHNALENWRFEHFGSHDNAGSAADDFDADADGEPNLLEFATGQNPQALTRSVTSLVLDGANLRFAYTRSKPALDAGLTFVVEYHDSLDATPWTPIGPGNVLVDAPLQSVEALVPAVSASRRFVRLRVVAP